MLGFGPLEWIALFVALFVYQASYVWLQAIVGWRFGLRVTEIGVGFVPVVHFRFRDAACRLGLLPLGGWTAFFAMHRDDKALPRDEVPDGALPFWALHPFKRIVLLMVGPASSLCIGLGVLSVMEWLSREEPAFLETPAVIGWCRPQSPLANAGLEEGDLVTAITITASGTSKDPEADGISRPVDGTTYPVASWRDLISALAITSKQVITLDVSRNGVPLVFQTRLEGCVLSDVSHESPDMVGDRPEPALVEGRGTGAFAAAVEDAGDIMKRLCRAFFGLNAFERVTTRPPNNHYRSLHFLLFTMGWSSVAMIMGTLGVLNCLANLVPFPVLNGGTILITLWEWMSGKRIPDAFMNTFSCLGLLFALLIFARFTMVLIFLDA